MTLNHVKVDSFRGLQQVITTKNDSLVADDPDDEGHYLGPNPYELLLAALGS